MEVSNQIITVIDDLAERLGIALDWTMPCLQKLANKFITYKISICTLWVVISILACVICLKFLQSVHKEKQNLCKIKERKYYDEYDDMEDITIWYVVSSVMVAILMGVTLLYNIFAILKLIVIPELYLFEYIQNMIK